MKIGPMLVKSGFVWLLGLLAPVAGFAEMRVGGEDDNSSVSNLAVITMGECENRFDSSPAASSCPGGGAWSAEQKNGVWHCSLEYDCQSGNSGGYMTVKFEGPLSQVSSLYFCGTSTFSTSSC